MKWYNFEHLYTDYQKNNRRNELEHLNYEELTKDLYNSCIDFGLEVSEEEIRKFMYAINIETQSDFIYDVLDASEDYDLNSIIGLINDIINANYEEQEEKRIYFTNYLRLCFNNYNHYIHAQEIEETIAWMEYESCKYLDWSDKENDYYYDFEENLKKCLEDMIYKFHSIPIWLKHIFLKQIIEITLRFYEFEELDLYNDCSRKLRKVDNDINNNILERKLQYSIQYYY